MSVSIGQQGSQYYVELKHQGQSVQIPCKDEEEAKKVAEEAKVVEQQIEAQEAVMKNKAPEQPASLPQSTPPEGVGEKLDKVA